VLLCACDLLLFSALYLLWFELQRELKIIYKMYEEEKLLNNQLQEQLVELEKLQKVSTLSHRLSTWL
jgi:hypothetical protein